MDGRLVRLVCVVILVLVKVRKNSGNLWLLRLKWLVKVPLLPTCTICRLLLIRCLVGLLVMILVIRLVIMRLTRCVVVMFGVIIMLLIKCRSNMVAGRVNRRKCVRTVSLTCNGRNRIWRVTAVERLVTPLVLLLTR